MSYKWYNQNWKTLYEVYIGKVLTGGVEQGKQAVPVKSTGFIFMNIVYVITYLNTSDMCLVKT